MIGREDDDRKRGRAVGAVAVLVVAVTFHEVLRRSLAGEAVVSALFAPKGPHTMTTLALGLAFVLLRVVLFVLVPGCAGAFICREIATRIRRTPLPRGRPPG